MGEIGIAIQELRQLAHGLRPSRLDAGLGPALEELADRAPLPVAVDATRERFPAGVEAAAYFIAWAASATCSRTACSTWPSSSPPPSASAGAALDPEVVARLISPGADEGLADLSDREREILSLMAEGLTNAGIAKRLVVSERTVEAHVGHVLLKLGIPQGADDHRRVLAVLTHLSAARARH